MQSWDEIYSKHGIIQKEPMEFIACNIQTLRARNVKRVLDLGCGTGRHLTLLLDEGFEVHGIDASPKAIEILTDILAEKDVSGVELKVDDFTDISFPEDYFDAIVCTNVIQHGRIHDVHKAAREIHRLLHSGGVLFLKTLSMHDGAYGLGEELEPNTFLPKIEPDGDIPHHFFTEEELRDVFRGFEIKSLTEETHKPKLRPIDKGFFWQLVGVRK